MTHDIEKELKNLYKSLWIKNFTTNKKKRIIGDIKFVFKQRSSIKISQVPFICIWSLQSKSLNPPSFIFKIYKKKKSFVGTNLKTLQEFFNNILKANQIYYLK
jgi:hypothetical protein